MTHSIALGSLPRRALPNTSATGWLGLPVVMPLGGPDLLQTGEQADMIGAQANRGDGVTCAQSSDLLSIDETC